MARVLFISEQFIKDNSYIDDNVDVKVLRQVIYTAQQMRIKPIVGTGIYDDLVTGVEAGDLTNVGGVNYKSLMDDYIQPCVEWWSLYESLLPLTLKIRNKGVQTQSSDNSQPQSMSDLKVYMDYLEDRAEWFSERATLFLCANESTYPKFNNPGTDVDTIYPNRNNYTSNIYLGDGKGCCETDTTIDLITGEVRGKYGN
jgi:hypothetical protein